MRQRGRQVEDRQRHLARHHPQHRRRRALERHMHHLDIGHGAEQFARKMRGAAIAAGTEAEIAGARFGDHDQLLHRFHRQRGMHDQNVRRRRHQRHRREILLRVVGQLAIEARVHRMRTGIAHDQRVTVGRRLGDEFRTDDAARARPRLDHHPVAQRIGELLPDRARHQVRPAARRRGHDHADRFGRIRLRRDRHRHHCAQQRHTRADPGLNIHYTPFCF